jgi:hypothetical protein
MPVRFEEHYPFPWSKVLRQQGWNEHHSGTKVHLNFSGACERPAPGSGISHTSYLYKTDDDDDEKSKGAF